MDADGRRIDAGFGPIARNGPIGRPGRAASVPGGRWGVAAGLAACALLAAGCLDLDLRIKINDDGSAVVTERVRFTEEVLDLASLLPANEGLEVILNRERAEERLRLMGRDVKLVSHAVNTLPGGQKECVTVYSVPDVNNLFLCSPAVAYLETDTAPMRLAHQPHYTDGSGYNIGTMTVVAHTPRTGRYPPGNPEGVRPALPADSPGDLQKYRDILPIFKDLMQDFHLRCVIDCYAPVGWATGRLAREMTREYVLVDFGSGQLDQYGGDILANEEFMLALIRWDLRSPHILNVVRHLQNNLTVPVWLPHRGLYMPSYGEDRYIALRPSKVLFEKFFKGKPQWLGGDVEAPRPARVTDEDLIKWGVKRRP